MELGLSSAEQRNECSTPRDLISPEVARGLVLEGVSSLKGVEDVSLAEAAGRVLAETVTAPRNLPPFDHSAVDGYAPALLASAEQEAAFPIVGRVAAGRPMTGEVPPGQAVRIFTGAAIPPGCDCVVMQEHAELRVDRVLPRRSYRAGDNVRLAGEDVATGAVILSADVLLDARHLALLAASGISTVAVRRRVRVAVMSTGTELRGPDEALSEGAIYDSNRIMLLALLRHPAVELIDGGIVADEGKAIATSIERLAAAADLVITSGGVSVGEEDLVRTSVAAAGGFLRRLKIAMKPGKPLAFGHVADAAILGLPGNPLAALVGYLVIGRHVVEKLGGIMPTGQRLTPAIANFARMVTPGRAEYAPATIVGRDNDGRPIVDTLGRGGSARLMPLSVADGFCVIPADVPEVRLGDAVGYVPMGDLALFT